MLKKAGHALVVGGTAVFIAEQVEATSTYTSQTDANMKMLYKYGGAALGAVIASWAWDSFIG